MERTIDGFKVTARIEYDHDMGEPWKEHDGHGVVSEWTTRAKRPGERVLNQDRGSYRYYDFAATVRLARRDDWDAPPYGTGTAKQRAERAAEADYRRMKAWCDNEWHWCGVVLSVSRAGICLDDHAASLWGIESDAGDYFEEVFDELIDDALDVARAKVAALTA